MKMAAPFVLLALIACGDDDQTTPDTSPQSVTLGFAAVVGDEPFACNQTFAIGSKATSVAFSDMRYYVHDVRLVDAQGNEVAVTLTEDGMWQHDGVALLDFEDATGLCSNNTAQTNAKITGTVTRGDYRGLRFKVGVPADLNHGNATQAASPLNATAMQWNWTEGYRYVRIDMNPAGGGGFAFHLGAMSCSGSNQNATCAREDIPEIALDAFDAASNTVVFDIAALTAETDVSTSQDSSPGCHSGASDQDCASMFENIGVDFATGAASGTQTTFSVR